MGINRAIFVNMSKILGYGYTAFNKNEKDRRILIIYAIYLFRLL